MIVYAESSAVLSWILGESRGEAVRRCLERAEFVVTSELTLVECDRMFHRARILEELPTERIEAHRSVLLGATADWVFLHLDREIIEKARQPFPEDPQKPSPRSLTQQTGTLIGRPIWRNGLSPKSNASCLRLRGARVPFPCCQEFLPLWMCAGRRSPGFPRP